MTGFFVHDMHGFGVEGFPIRQDAMSRVSTTGFSHLPFS